MKKNKLIVYGLGIILTVLLLFMFNFDQVKEYSKEKEKNPDASVEEIIKKYEDGKIPFPESDEDLEVYKMYLQAKIQATVDEKQSYEWIKNLSDSDRQRLLGGESIDDLHQEKNRDRFMQQERYAEQQKAQEQKEGFLSSIASWLGFK